MISFGQEKIFQLNFCGELAPEGKERRQLSPGDLVNREGYWVGRKEGGSGGGRHVCGAVAALAEIVDGLSDISVLEGGREGDAFPALDRTGGGPGWQMLGAVVALLLVLPPGHVQQPSRVVLGLACHTCCSSSRPRSIFTTPSFPLQAAQESSVWQYFHYSLVPTLSSSAEWRLAESARLVLAVLSPLPRGHCRLPTRGVYYLCRGLG